MRRTARLLVCAGVSIASLVHCGSFGEATIAPVTDSGSAPGAEGGAPEAGPDGRPAAPAPFNGCASTLADDFERTPLGVGPWSGVPAISGGAVVASDFEMPFDGMRSLRIDVPSAESAAYFQKFLGVRTRVRLAFALRSAGHPARSVAVNSIELPTIKISLYFVVDGGMVKLREQRFDMTGNPSTTHALGPVDTSWHRYELTLDMTTKAHARVDIDGAHTFDADLAYPLVASSIVVRGGVSFALPGTETTVWLDDVVVCNEP